MKYANMLNRRAFQYLLSGSEDEELLLTFLNCFLKAKLALELAKINETNTLHSNPFFHFKGCLSNEIIIDAISIKGNRVFVQLDLLFLHWGLMNINIELTDKLDFYRSRREEVDVPVTFVHLSFATFDLNNSGETFVGHTDLHSATKDLTVHFLWFNLPNFSLEKNELSELEQWVLFLTQANQLKALPNTITVQSVKAAFQKSELQNWKKEELVWYQESESDLEKRQKRIWEHYQMTNIKLDPNYLKSSAPYAFLNGWKVLLKNLGVFPKKTVRPEEIIIKERNNNVVFTLFRHWTKQVEIKEEKIITIKSEQELTKDFESALRKAVIYIYTDDSILKNNFDDQQKLKLLAIKINAELNLHWHFEYLIKNTPLFKSMQALRATLAYFAGNEIIEMKIDSLYRDFLNESTNLYQISTNIDAQKVSDLINIGDELFSNVPSQTRTVLKNLMGEMVLSLKKQTKDLPFYLENAGNIHDYSLLKTVILDNKSLFQ